MKTMILCAALCSTVLLRSSLGQELDPLETRKEAAAILQDDYHITVDPLTHSTAQIQSMINAAAAQKTGIPTERPNDAAERELLASMLNKIYGLSLDWKQCSLSQLEHIQAVRDHASASFAQTDLERVQKERAEQQLKAQQYEEARQRYVAMQAAQRGMTVVEYYDWLNAQKQAAEQAEYQRQVQAYQLYLQTLQTQALQGISQAAQQMSFDQWMRSMSRR